jgi:hypothetical protein
MLHNGEIYTIGISIIGIHGEEVNVKIFSKEKKKGVAFIIQPFVAGYFSPFYN